MRCEKCGWLGHDAAGYRMNKGSTETAKPKQIDHVRDKEQGTGKSNEVVTVEGPNDKQKAVSNEITSGESSTHSGNIVMEKQQGKRNLGNFRPGNGKNNRVVEKQATRRT